MSRSSAGLVEISGLHFSSTSLLCYHFDACKIHPSSYCFLVSRSDGSWPDRTIPHNLSAATPPHTGLPGRLAGDLLEPLEKAVRSKAIRYARMLLQAACLPCIFTGAQSWTEIIRTACLPPPPPGPRSLGPLLPFVLSLPMMRRASIKASWYLEKAYFREVSSEPVAACHGMLQQSASYWPYFDQDRLNCHCWCRELNPPDGVQKFVYHRQVRELRCPLFNNQMGLLAPAAACSMI